MNLRFLYTDRRKLNTLRSGHIQILQAIIAKTEWACAHGLRNERSGFEPWPWSLCCVLKQDTLISNSASLHPGE